MPPTLYVGTYPGIFEYSGGGLYKSTNGGLSWSAASNGLPSDQGVCSLVIDPATPSILYAGTFSGGVFKSTDGGGSWAAVNNGQPYRSVSSLAIDPATPATLYTSVFYSYKGGSGSGGVFKSTDGGGSWQAVNNGLPADPWVSNLVIDPTTPTTLYAGIYIPGIYASLEVYKSTNGGGSWSTFNAGLANTAAGRLVIDPKMPSKLYAGTDGGGVFSIVQMEVRSQVYLPVVRFGP